MFVCWRVAHGLAIEAFGGSFFSSAFQFDAGYFLDIAEHGYVFTDPTYTSFQTVAFFPLFPMLARPFVEVLGVQLGGSLVVNALALGAFIAVWRAATTWFDDRIGRLSVILLALWPASMFMWAFYNESLFVLITASAFVAERAERRWVSVPLVFLAGLTRSVGFFFGPVLAICRWWRCRRLDATTVAYLASAAASFAAMLLIMNAVADDPFAFSAAQKPWGRDPSAPWTPALNAVRHLVSELPRLAQETSMNLVAVLLVLVLGSIGTWIALRSRHEPQRPPLEPGLWALTAIGVTQFTSLISAMIRYVLSAWTGFVVLACLLKDRPILRWASYAVLLAVSLFLLRRSASNTFVA